METRSSIIRPLYIAEVERKFANRDEARVSSGLYSASGIGLCARAAYYDRAVKHNLIPNIPPPLPTQWKFSQGLIVEKIMVDGLLVKYPEGKPQVRWTSEAYQMAGVIDWYDPAVMMAECKGMMGRAWDKQKGDVAKGKVPFKPHFIAQLASYKWLSGLDAPEARLFCTAYEVFPLIDEYILEDDAVYQLFDNGSSRWYKNPWSREAIIREATRRVEWWEAKQLPPIELAEDAKWECRYCVHAPMCANNINPLIS